MPSPAAARDVVPVDDVRAALDARLPEHRRDLEALVRIPSVSAPGFDPAAVRASADAVRDLLAARGFEHARLLEVDGAHPAVAADHLSAGPDAPTVLLYAHHDVQPPGPEAAWTTPPFAPAERDGRLYGRGAADDKAGILVHVAAVDAWLSARGALPVNVKVLVEGEEETGSEHLGTFLARYGEELRADVVVLTDSVNWRIGVPAITATLRGLVDCEVTVRGLDHAVHSGMYGGAVPDAVTGLVRLLAGLVDEEGRLAIPGFGDDAVPSAAERDRLAGLDLDIASFRADAGVLEGVDLVGGADIPLLERLWARPAVTITGMDVPGVEGASNTIQPSARAHVSVRLGPSQDPDRARDLLVAWLQDAAPWGLQVEVTPGAAAAGFVADASAPAFGAASRAFAAAYGEETVVAGIGGTIPIVGPFVDAFTTDPSRPVTALLTGVEDPDSRAHGIDESLHLGDWRHACLGEAYLFSALAGGPVPPGPPGLAGLAGGAT